MVVKLKVGYQHFLLPDDRGLQTAMRTLSRAIRIQSDDRYKGGGIDLDTDPVEVSMEMLPDIKLVQRKRGTGEVFEPELVNPKRLNGRRGLPRGSRRGQLMLEG